MFLHWLRMNVCLCLTCLILSVPRRRTTYAIKLVLATKEDPTWRAEGWAIRGVYVLRDAVKRIQPASGALSEILVYLYASVCCCVYA